MYSVYIDCVYKYYFYVYYFVDFLIISFFVREIIKITFIDEEIEV